MNTRRRFVPIVDWFLAVVIIIASLVALAYMYVTDYTSIGLFLALLIFLYTGVQNLMKRKQKTEQHKNSHK